MIVTSLPKRRNICLKLQPDIAATNDQQMFGSVSSSMIVVELSTETLSTPFDRELLWRERQYL